MVCTTGNVHAQEAYIFRKYVVLCIIILSLVSGLRYNVGTDYMGYTYSFDIRANKFWVDLLHFREPGLGFLALLGHFITSDYVILFLFSALLTVYLNVKTICKYSENVFLGITLYLLIGAWHNSFNAIRQYLAAGVLFAGHRYMLERKFWKYVLVVFLAMCFHRTAIIMLPVYFVVDKKFSIKTIMYMLGGAILLHSLSEYLMQIMSFLKGHEQSGYAYMQQEVNILRPLATLPPIIFAFFTPKEFRNQPENSFYLSLMVLNAAFMFATENSAYLARIGIYTEIFLTLGIPCYIKYFRSENKTFYTIGFIFFWGIFWAYEISVRASLNHFQWIFSR